MVDRFYKMEDGTWVDLSIIHKASPALKHDPMRLCYNIYSLVKGSIQLMVTTTADEGNRIMAAVNEYNTFVHSMGARIIQATEQLITQTE